MVGHQAPRCHGYAVKMEDASPPSVTSATIALVSDQTEDYSSTMLVIDELDNCSIPTVMRSPAIHSITLSFTNEGLHASSGGQMASPSCSSYAQSADHRAVAATFGPERWRVRSVGA